MVTQPIEAPVETDPIPETTQETDAPVEVEVEVTPTETVGDAPAEEVAVEPETVTAEIEVPEERRYTEAELREQAFALAAQQREQERKQWQSQQARKANQEAQERADREERMELVQAALMRGDEPEAVTRLLDRHAQKYEGQTFKRAGDALGEAIKHIDDLATIGDAEPLSPQGQQMFERILPFVSRIGASIGAYKSPDEIAQEYVPKADIPKLQKAAVEAYLAKQREGKPELKRPEGSAPASNVMSWAAYQALPDADKMAMSPAERQAIMAADRKVRLGG